MIYRAAAATCPGKKKSYNSNNFYLNSKYITEEFCSSQVLLTQKKDQKGLQLYAISEGQGADTYAEEASLIAVKNMFKFHGKKLQELAAMKEAGKPTTGMDMVGFVNTYIQSANHAVKTKAASLGDDQLRATLAMICVKGKRVVTANLGNTRIYHFRNGLLQQISEDHTQAQKMVNLNLLTPERAAAHPKRHKLTQYLGIHNEENPLEPAVFEMTAEADDVFLICSRAFCESIMPEDIQAILSRNHNVSDIIDKLMAEASENGFQEDTTLVVLQALETPKPVVAPVVEGGAKSEGPITAADVRTRPNTWRTEEGTVSDRRAAGRPVSKTSLFVHDEDEQETDNAPAGPATPVRRPTVGKAPAKKVGVMAKIKSFLGLDSDSPDAQIWPAVIVFALCLIIIILFVVLGWKFLSGGDDHENAPLPSISVTADNGATPTSAPTEEPTQTPSASIGPGGIWAPTQTPTATQTPTEDPAGTPTEEPTGTPTEDPAGTPTEDPASTPTEDPAGTPTDDPASTPTGDPAGTPTDAPAGTPTEVPSSTPTNDSTGA